MNEKPSCSCDAIRVTRRGTGLVEIFTAGRIEELRRWRLAFGTVLKMEGSSEVPGDVPRFDILQYLPSVTSCDPV
jgi:hypothetical protein